MATVYDLNSKKVVDPLGDDPDSPAPKAQLNVPQVQLNCGTTLQSPFFWMVVGGVAVLGIIYMFNRRR